VFDPFDETLSRQVFQDALPRLKAVESGIRGARLGCHFAVLINDYHLWQLVTKPTFEVVEVMRGSYLDRAASKLRAGEVVGDQRDLSPNQREHYCLSEKMGVSLVSRIHRDCGIAEHCFRASSGNHNVTRPVFERVA